MLTDTTAGAICVSTKPDRTPTEPKKPGSRAVRERDRHELVSASHGGAGQEGGRRDDRHACEQRPPAATPLGAPADRSPDRSLLRHPGPSLVRAVELGCSSAVRNVPPSVRSG